jgi:hypothetical protein
MTGVSLDGETDYPSKPRGIKNGNPLGINQNVRRQTKRKYTTQNRKLKS